MCRLIISLELIDFLMKSRKINGVKCASRIDTRSLGFL